MLDTSATGSRVTAKLVCGGLSKGPGPRGAGEQPGLACRYSRSSAWMIWKFLTEA